MQTTQEILAALPGERIAIPLALADDLDGAELLDRLEEELGVYRRDLLDAIESAGRRGDGRVVLQIPSIDVIDARRIVGVVCGHRRHRLSGQQCGVLRCVRLQWPREWARLQTRLRKAGKLAHVRGAMRSRGSGLGASDPDVDEGADMHGELEEVGDEESEEEDDDPDLIACVEPYEEHTDGTYLMCDGHDGPKRIRLANFRARIVGTTRRDDGACSTRYHSIEVDIGGRTESLDVPAREYSSMGWTGQLPPDAVVEAGPGRRDHLRAAIQLLSSAEGPPPETVVHIATGWRRIDEHDVYVHGGGAISCDGPVDGIAVELPDRLAGYELPPPPEGDELREAVRASLRMLELGPPAVPVWALVYRAALGGPVEHSHALVGDSGEGKTQVAALGQQHFGARMGAGLDEKTRLPADWTNHTENELCELLATAKDAVLVIDDWRPTGSEAERKLDRVVRSLANVAVRGRLTSAGRLRPQRPPGCAVLLTAEGLPQAESLRARMTIDQVSPGDILAPRGDNDESEPTVDPRLAVCQDDAENGLYAAAMAGYVQWLARDLPARQEQMREDRRELRRTVRAGGHHRTPSAITDLGAGLRMGLRFAVEVSAISEAESDQIWSSAWAALLELGRRQAELQREAAPRGRFIEALASAISTGQANVAAMDGGAPSEPGKWGWRLRESGSGPDSHQEWRPRGTRIGWVDGTNLYLEPHQSYAVAERLARAAKQPLGVTMSEMKRRLRKARHLQSRQKDHLTVQREIEGRRGVRVLHVAATLLDGSPPRETGVSGVGGVGGKSKGTSDTGG